MAKREYDDEGRPVAVVPKMAGMLSIKGSPEAWAAVQTALDYLKGIGYAAPTVTDAVRFLLAQGVKRIKDQPLISAGEYKKEQGPDAPPAEQDTRPKRKRGAK